MTLRVRFAPSPTGWLHLGNIRTAVINWMHAKQAGGAFLLRIDDTDLERSTEEFRLGIEEDMTWLGLTWDDYAKQSERFDEYDKARDGLIASGRLYACYETGPELELMRKTASIQGKPFIYNRAAYPLSAEDEAKYKAEGREAHWRFALKPGEIKWDDLARGETSFMAENLSDPVLIRGDGSYLYTLCSVLDDIDLGMTEAQWTAIQPNLEKLNDVTDWLALIHGPVTPEIEDADFAAKAAALLPEGTLDGDSWKSWTDAVKEATGAKGKSLFMPLRLALTGQPRGPEMAVLLPLIDRTKIIARLNGQAA